MLGTLSGPESGAGAINGYAKPRALNNRAQVVGKLDFHGFLWQDGRMSDLRTLPGDKYSDAVDINRLGQIVGTSQSWPSLTRHAVLWTYTL